jgi:glutaredoxin
MIVTLYSKPGCHLCENARALLDELASERRFAVDEIDIQRDAALFERFRHDIPVVLVDGVEIARGRIDERHLIAALARSGQDAPGGRT